MPGEHAAIRDQPGRRNAGIRQAGKSPDFDTVREFLERRLDLRFRTGGSVERDRHEHVLHPVHFRGPIERGAQSRPIVTGGRLHVDLVEDSQAHQLAVGCTIERRSTRQGKTPQARLLREITAYMNDSPLEAFLDRGRDVAVLLGDLGFRHASFDQRFIEVFAGRKVILPLFPRVIDAENRDADRSVGL